MRTKTWKTTNRKVWSRLLTLTPGHVVEVEGVVGRVMEVTGKWDWFKNAGWVTVQLAESKRELEVRGRGAHDSREPTNGKGGENGNAKSLK